MNAFHKINCIKKKEVTQLLKRFILFTFLDPDTSLSETLHSGISFVKNDSFFYSATHGCRPGSAASGNLFNIVRFYAKFINK